MGIPSSRRLFTCASANETMGSSWVSSLLIVSVSSLVLLTSSQSVDPAGLSTKTAFHTGAATICAKILNSDICEDTVASFPVDSVKALKPDPVAILSMHMDKAQAETEKAIVEFKALSANKTAMQFAHGF